MRSGGIVIESPFLDRMARVKYRRATELAQEQGDLPSVKVRQIRQIRQVDGS